MGLTLTEWLLVMLVVQCAVGFSLILRAIATGRGAEPMAAFDQELRKELGIPRTPEIARDPPKRPFPESELDHLTAIPPYLERGQARILEDSPVPPVTTARPDLVQCFDADGHPREWVRKGSLAHKRYLKEQAGRN